MTQSAAALLNGDGPPEQDYVILGSKRTPGRATIVSPGSPRKWDKQAGFGISGATLAFLGDDLSEFDLLVDLWEPEHWTAWTSFARDVLDKRPRGRISPEGAFDIVHPALNRSPTRISSVVVLDVTGPDQEDGLWTFRIKLSAYRQPKPALGKPPAAVPAVPGVTPTAKTAEDQAIADLLAEQARLGGAL